MQLAGTKHRTERVLQLSHGTCAWIHGDGHVDAVQLHIHPGTVGQAGGAVAQAELFCIAQSTEAQGALPAVSNAAHWRRPLAGVNSHLQGPSVPSPCQLPSSGDRSVMDAAANSALRYAAATGSHLHRDAKRGHGVGGARSGGGTPWRQRREGRPASKLASHAPALRRAYHSARRSCAAKSAQPAALSRSGSVSACGDAITTDRSASAADTRHGGHVRIIL